MAHRPQPSLADYVALALSPALVMTLVGSLVFFLLEVCYGGRYEGRMQWILFSFVFGAVLIARISMTAGISERAPLYGIGLGLVVWLALAKFVEIPQGIPLARFSWVINLGLIALIWWAAHKLTRDCTYIDETVDASGAGLLQGGSEPGEVEAAANEEKAEQVQAGWLARYRDYREREKKRPHAPGKWIVYFSLAALPLFGLGQASIPTEEIASRTYAFWLMVVYVASGLGLLLTTSFLGLRRYLRQRKLSMPVSMTAVWLGIGGILIVVLLVGGALLPRPHAEYSMLRFTKIGAQEREASRSAPAAGEPGKGPGAGRHGSNEGEGNAAGQGKTSGGKSQAEGKSGTNGNGQGSSKGDGRNGTRAGNEPGRGQDQPAQPDTGEHSGRRAADRAADRVENQKSDADQTSGSETTDPGLSLPPMLQGLSKLLKGVIVFLVGAVILLIVLWLLLRHLANFTSWARRLLAVLDQLWRGLWGSRSTQPEVAASRHQAEAMPRPFASFRNPFAEGPSGSAVDLVRYSFEALEAWAWEQGLGRRGDDTPLEFAERIGVEAPLLTDDARRLASLYARAAYSRSRLPASAVALLQQFWRQLDSVAATPSR
jgi:hypothetical protein